MLRKLVIASAAAAAAAGLGLASPAYGDDLVQVTCVGPTFGDETNTAEVGSIIGAVTATGDALTELIHDEGGHAVHLRLRQRFHPFRRQHDHRHRLPERAERRVAVDGGAPRGGVTTRCA